MKHTLIIFSLFLTISMVAQVPRNIVVEHFTNSRCGTCASRNPGFFTNLSNHPNVIHLAIYPSAPYNTCVFSQHNASENDARTNFYGIYGATPRLVIQGNVISASTNYGDAAIFNNVTGQTSPFTVRIDVGNTNIAGEFTVNVVVKTEATHNYATLNLFAAIAEDTVFYNAPNGENTHYNVFRESVFETAGKSITPSMMLGDSVVFSETMTFDPTWQAPRLEGIAILQDANKTVIQAATSKNQVFTATENIETAPFKLYTAQNRLYFQADHTQIYDLQVFDLQGKVLRQLKSNGNDVWTFNDLTTGVYLIRVSQNEKVWARLLPFTE